jgi:hypothetical protein
MPKPVAGDERQWGFGGRSPHAFSLRRNSDLWSEFFTILNQNTISVAVIKKTNKGLFSTVLGRFVLCFR